MKKSVVCIQAVLVAGFLAAVCPQGVCAQNCDKAKRDVAQAEKLFAQPSPDTAAITALTRSAMQDCPAWSVPVRNYGVLMAEQRKFAEAVDYYLKALALDPKDFEANFYLGDAYTELGKEVHACRFYSKGIQILTADPAGKSKNRELFDGYEKKYSVAARKVNYRDEELLAVLDKKQASRLGVSPNIDTRIEFDYDSASIKDDWKAQLDTLADVLKKENMQQYRIIIQGHTDDKGDSQYNTALSQKRADAVKSYLLAVSVPQAMLLAAQGKGKSRLLDKSAGESEDQWRQRNRRVMFISCDSNDAVDACLQKSGAQ